MANNRMVVICSVCREAVSFAKYYPSTDWYAVDNATTKLNQFFARHQHDLGETRFEFDYETGGGKWTYEPGELLPVGAPIPDATCIICGKPIVRGDRITTSGGTPTAVQTAIKEML